MFKAVLHLPLFILLFYSSNTQAIPQMDASTQLKNIENDTFKASVTEPQKITSDSMTSKTKHDLDFLFSLGVSLNKPIIKIPIDGKPTSDHGYNIAVMKHFFQKGIFMLGFHAGWEYTNSSGQAYAKYPATFSVKGSQHTFDDDKTCGCIFQKSTKYELGLQLTVTISKHFSLSPVLLLGHFQLTQEPFHISQTFEYNRTNYTYRLLSQDKIKNAGYYPISKLRANLILIRNTTIWIEATTVKNYKITNNLVRFVPSGNVDVSGWYTFQQMNSGTYKTTKQETKYDFVGLNIGVSFGLTNVKN